EVSIPPTEDVSEVSRVLSGVRRTWELAGAEQDQIEDIKDFEDAQSPRFMLQGPDGQFTQVLNTVDAEETIAKWPQNYRPKIYSVDLKSLSAGALTADVLDLAPPGDRRVFFMPWVQEEAKP